MATYLVGDLHGCLEELKSLLKQVAFSPEKDQLWIVGDLVARGAHSLETLRFVKALGDAAKVVLGNHDLHLLAISLGIHQAKPKDKTLPILAAEDRESLLDWLRHQPLLQEHDEFVMCHAGISPQWDLVQARACAQEVEAVLRSERWPWLLEQMYSNSPDAWSTDLTGIERYRYIINAYTRMRFCFPDGRLDMACKLPPQEVSEEELLPWFKLHHRVNLDKPVIFGHWAALEGIQSSTIIGLDTGCVWGGKMTMLRWEDQTYFEQAAIR